MSYIFISIGFRSKKHKKSKNRRGRETKGTDLGDAYHANIVSVEEYFGEFCVVARIVTDTIG